MPIQISGFTFQGGVKIDGRKNFPYGSLNFVDSSSQSIRTATGGSPAFAFGTGDYTIEFWVYPTSTSRQDWFNLINVNNNYRITIYYYNNTQISFDAGTVDAATTRILYPIDGASLVNNWYHIAVSRVSGFTKMFINGNQVGSTFTDTLNFSDTAMRFDAGRDPTGQINTYMRGNLANIRVVKGVGVYTGNFTVPVDVLQVIQDEGTNISAITAGQTQLLLNTLNNADFLKDSSPNNFTITNNNNVTKSNLSPF